MPLNALLLGVLGVLAVHFPRLNRYPYSHRRLDRAGQETVPQLGGARDTKKDVDDRAFSPLSMMPNGLNEGMTLQDFADVIAFLEARREEKTPPKKDWLETSDGSCRALSCCTSVLTWSTRLSCAFIAYRSSWR
jgi:hypothetical protein